MTAPRRGRPPGSGRATLPPVTPTVANTDLSYTEEMGWDVYEQPADPAQIARRLTVEAQAEALKVNWQDSQKREAERWGVDYALWITLTDAQKAQYMRQKPPDWKQPAQRTATMGEIRADSQQDTGGLEQEFQRRAQEVLAVQDEVDWVVVCDPVKQHRDWGTYTPGLSRISRRQLEHKLRPRGDGRPNFTISPVAPFMPPEEVFCDIPGLDGSPCAYGAWYDPGRPGISTMLERHKKRRHPEEWDSGERIITRTAAESSTSRDAALIETLKQQSAALAALMERFAQGPPKG